MRKLPLALVSMLLVVPAFMVGCGRPTASKAAEPTVVSGRTVSAASPGRQESSAALQVRERVRSGLASPAPSPVEAAAQTTGYVQPTSTPPTPQSPFPIGSTVVISKQVTLFSFPHRAPGELAVLPPGTRVTFLGVQGPSYRVEFARPGAKPKIGFVDPGAVTRDDSHLVPMDLSVRDTQRDFLEPMDLSIRDARPALTTPMDLSIPELRK